MGNNSQKSRLMKRFLWVTEYAWLALESIWLYCSPKKKYMKSINDAVKKNLSRQANTLTFLKALAINPKGTGAVLPSSKRLAYEMASHVKLSNESFVVELGAGTGVITKAMLMSGVNPKQIIAIEYASRLANQLQENFPDIEVIKGNAADLIKLLDEKSQHVDTIISGLPLRSLPEETVQSVLSEISSILSSGGRYIQFTYDIRSDSSYYPENFHLKRSKIIWWNIPPAKVEVFVVY